MFLQFLANPLIEANHTPRKTQIILLRNVVKHGSNGTLVAVLLDEHEQPVAGRVVEFYIYTLAGWNYIGANTTDEHGIAVFTFYVTLPNGTYLVKATFKGDDLHLGSEDVSEITVEEDPPPLALLLIPILKGMINAAALRIILDYVIEPFVLKPLSDYIKRSNLPYKEYYDDPEELKQIIETILLLTDVANLVKNAWGALIQYRALIVATGKSRGGHARWFWHYAKELLENLSEMIADHAIEKIEEKIRSETNYSLVDEEERILKNTFLSCLKTSEKVQLYKGSEPVLINTSIVDPLIGHGEILNVPDGVKRLRMYIGWNQSRYVENFFVLKDPFGNIIEPKVNLRLGSDPTETNVTVEIIVVDPTPGDWILWINGTKLPNEKLGIIVYYDKVFEVYPQHLAINPGFTREIAVVVNNFMDQEVSAVIGVRDIPSGWSISLSANNIVIPPNSSHVILANVSAPHDIRYGASQSLFLEATIGGTSYIASFNVYTQPLIEIEEGLRYLYEVQREDGSWMNVGITALATLAFLNAGYDENEEPVRKAVNYILSRVHEDGSIYDTHPTYETSLALLVLVATHNNTYRDIIRKARDWLLNTQWDEDTPWGSVTMDYWYYGGWGYGSGERPDLSNTQFALMALDAARVSKEDPVWAKAQVFLARVQNRQENVFISELNYTVTWTPQYNAYNDGGFVYHPGASLAGGMRSYGSMTAAGLWSLKLCGVPNDDPRVQAALNWISDNYTWDENPGMGHYGLYYFYLTLSKALIMTVGVDGEINGRKWYDELVRKIVSLQRPDGSWIGKGFWEDIPELATAYAISSMQYRVVPTNVKAFSWITFILRSSADLHIYDSQGRHVGKNYFVGGVDLEIPNAYYSYDGYVNITIRDLELSTYRIVLIGTSKGEYNLTVIMGNGKDILYQESIHSSISKGEIHEGHLVVTMMIGLTARIMDKPRPIENALISSTGIGNIYIHLNHGIVSSLYKLDEKEIPSYRRLGVRFLYGVLNITIDKIKPGQTIKLLIGLPVNVPTEAQYWTYYMNNWCILPFFSNDGDHLISLVLTDGGVGDYDGIANGVVVHIGGIGLPQPERPLIEYITITVTEPMQLTERELNLPMVSFIAFTFTIVLTTLVAILVISRRGKVRVYHGQYR